MSSVTSGPAELRGLPDPEFYARWTEIRQKYAVTNIFNPEYQSVKQMYIVAFREFHRRMVEL